MNAKLSLALSLPATLVLAALLTALAGCGGKEPLVTPDSPVTATGKAPTISVDANEIELVEKVAEHRLAYKAYLEALHVYYIRHGMYDKQRGAERELAGLQRVRQYTYLLLTDLPASAVVKPTDKIAEADVLYQDAMNYLAEGKVLPLINNKDKLRMALDKLNALVRKYPNSDKVDDALFYAAEILKEYFQEDDMAVEYYKRAYEADANTPHPAHFQRAAVLDLRLHNRSEALKEYELVLKTEADKPFAWSKSNADFATRRIKELKGEK